MNTKIMSYQFLIISIILSVLIGASGLFFPILTSTFNPYYANIAKHIILSNNWYNLILSNQDWLDKPHLPFWLTAISFTIFGITSFAYILSGFICNIVGVYYTYKLAKIIYNKQIAILSILFYLTTLHLMLSAIDVRAEAYLMPSIMGASYYLLKYYNNNKLSSMLMAAMFIALALMTKGIFILITIFSGLIILCILQHNYRQFLSLKWYLLLLLAFILIAPELISLYLQFDNNPEKIVFGVNHVSGIKWFFWDSQFGRFFNTGPIMTTNPMSYHYLFFVHTFLWAYLPWSPLFVIYLIYIIKQMIKRNYVSIDIYQYYLLASFFITFILFSATSFQVDHYTNIIFPFANILCAKYIYDILLTKQLSWLKIVTNINIIVSIVLLILLIIFSYIVYHNPLITIIISITSILFILYYKKYISDKCVSYIKIMLLPIVAINSIFLFLMFINGTEYIKYDAGYQLAKHMNIIIKDNNKLIKNTQIFVYKLNDMSLDFHIKNNSHNYHLINNFDSINNIFTKHYQNNDIYLITPIDQLNAINQHFTYQIVSNKIFGASIEGYMQNLIKKLHNKTQEQQLSQYIILQVISQKH